MISVQKNILEDSKKERLLREGCGRFIGQIGLLHKLTSPPQSDWEYKHDKATLTGVPDQILEENTQWKAKNV